MKAQGRLGVEDEDATIEKVHKKKVAVSKIVEESEEEDGELDGKPEYVRHDLLEEHVVKKLTVPDLVQYAQREGVDVADTSVFKAKKKP